MRPLLGTLVLLPSLLAGCGAEAPPPPPPQPQQPTIPIMPPEQPKAPPTGRALLVASEFGLSPLACWRDNDKSFAAGDACLDLAPAGSEVWLMTGARAARVTARGTATCPGAAAPEQTILIEATRDELRGDAVLPPDLKDSLVYIPPTPPPDVDRDVPRDLRALVARAITAAHPELGDVKPRIDQRARVDLDGDGAAEELVAAVVPGKARDDDAPLRLSVLLVIPPNGAPGELRARTDTRERYTVIGSLDLDGDGGRELYLNTYDDDAFSLSLERRDDAGLKSLGRWSCGG